MKTKPKNSMTKGLVKTHYAIRRATQRRQLFDLSFEAWYRDEYLPFTPTLLRVDRESLETVWLACRATCLKIFDEEAAVACYAADEDRAVSVDFNVKKVRARLTAL